MALTTDDGKVIAALGDIRASKIIVDGGDDNLKSLVQIMNQTIIDQRTTIQSQAARIDQLAQQPDFLALLTIVNKTLNTNLAQAADTISQQAQRIAVLEAKDKNGYPGKTVISDSPLSVVNDNLYLTARKNVYIVSEPKMYNVTEGPNSWLPSNLTVSVGDTIRFRWTNPEAIILARKSDPSNIIFRSGNITQLGDNFFDYQIMDEFEHLFSGAAKTQYKVNVVVLANRFFGGYQSSITPVGIIMMWSGAITSIPAGFALCDGSTVNGFSTPNLADKFIVAAGRAYVTNAQGGQDSTTLTVANLPPHSHASQMYSKSAPSVPDCIEYYNQCTYRYGYVDQMSSSVGSATPIENRPKYFALAYIVKVPSG